MVTGDQMVHTWEHRGMKIKLNEAGHFRVGEESDCRYFASLDLAKEEIADRLAVEAKARHADLAMPVIDEHGVRHVIRGLNRGSGKLLGLPDRIGTLYYPTPTIEAMTRERAGLERRSEALWSKLRRVVMPDHIGSGRIRSEDYDRRIQELKDKYAAAMEAAEDLDDAPVVTGLAKVD